MTGQKLLWIALAGALGTVSRYVLSLFAGRIFNNSALPWGTIIVNVVGCFLFGVIWTLADERMLINEETRLIVLTGYMGAFTTFSTFIFESGGLINQANWLLAGGNMIGQVVVGLIFLFVGLGVGKLF